MPHLYDFDDYDRCLQEFKSPSTYCFVRAEVLPQAGSESWQAIASISKHDKHHFDHRQLNFGLCLRWCEKSLLGLNEKALDDLYNGILTNNSNVNTYLQLFSSEAGNRQRYNRLTNQCINLRLKAEYGLKAKTVIEYCNTNHDVIEQDNWNMTFYSIVCILILLATFSSFYDLYLKHQLNNKTLIDRDHYKAPVNSLVPKILVTFSIARNWYRLSQEPSGKAGRDLRFLDCLKFFSMFLVIFAHTNWTIYEAGISNPQDPERLLHTAAGTMLMSGNLITMTFLVISGLLLTLSWLSVTKKKEKLSLSQYIGIFINFNVFRYIRLTAPYGLMILASGVYFDNAGGPLWRHILEREQLSCRKNWWTNLLYINNYVNNDERCMLQSWYLAADTHSFVLSLILLMIAHKWPRIRNTLFGTVFAFFYVLPGVLTYFNEYTPIMIASPQTQKDSFIGDKNFAGLYAPFQMNFGGYFCGVVTALIYNYISESQIKLKDYKIIQIIWYGFFPLGVLWLLSAHPFVQNIFNPPPLVWGSVYAAIQRTTWSIGVGVVIIGMASKIGWIFREFACLPIFRILGRLSYGVFVIHVLVVRMALGGIRQPIFFDMNILFAFILFTLVLSYLLSFILAILVELPVSACLKFMRSK